MKAAAADSGESSHSHPRRDVRVLVVDDQTYFRGVLGELVAATAGFTLVGDASDGEQALSLTAELGPDFVLMDIRMPGLDGLAAARLMVERPPRLVVLLVSPHDPPTAAGLARSAARVHFADKRELSGSLLLGAWGAGERAHLA